MEIFLTIDRGNTAIKGALWSPDGRLLVSDTVIGISNAGELARKLTQGILDTGELICGACYCSVVAAEREADIAGLKPLCRRVVDVSARIPLPVTIGYETPGTLGADRIAAAAGGRELAQGRPVLIADIGTAVTYDYVDADGTFAGGNIAPGVYMRLEALHAFTAALPEVNPWGETPVWGRTTADAMRSGAVRGIIAELKYFHQAAGSGALVVLTGGCAKLIAESAMLDFDFIHDPFVVHKGLLSILRYNEN